MTKDRQSVPPTRLETTALRLTAWVGSIPSLIAHTVAFLGSLALGVVVGHWDIILLVLTTVVSLEAIYLAIFIQMTVNRNTESLEEVEEDIDEIQEDVDEIQQDVDEIQEDVDEIQEDIDEIQEDDDKPTTPQAAPVSHPVTLNDIQHSVQHLLAEIEKLQAGR